MRGRERDRETETESEHVPKQPLVHTSNIYNSRGWTKAKVKGQECNPGLPHGQPEPNDLTHHCCLSQACTWQEGGVRRKNEQLHLTTLK